jgi:hypothetical protein
LVPVLFPVISRVKILKSMTSIGKTARVCVKSFSQLLGAKPVDGLRLSQSLWVKSENLLRSTSHVLGTAEFFLSAVGALLQGKEGDDLTEVKSLLLQVDQALGSSQCLLMGTLANFTLSKRREILEKSSVNEILQDSLLRSPLSDKVFGLSLQKGIGSGVSGTPSFVGQSDSYVSDFRQGEIPSSVRGSSISITEKSNRGNSSDSVDTKVLFSFLLGSQENRGNATCDRSLYSQQLPFGSPFQNGDQQIYQSLYSSRYVDHQTGRKWMLISISQFLWLPGNISDLSGTTRLISFWLSRLAWRLHHRFLLGFSRRL